MVCILGELKPRIIALESKSYPDPDPLPLNWKRKPFLESNKYFFH